MKIGGGATVPVINVAATRILGGAIRKIAVLESDGETIIPTTAGRPTIQGAVQPIVFTRPNGRPSQGGLPIPVRVLTVAPKRMSGLPIPVVVDEPYFVYDCFTDPNGILLPNHAPDWDRLGNGWVAHSGTWIITAGQAHVSVLAAADQMAGIHVGEANPAIAADITVTNDGAVAHRVGLLFRYAAANAWWIFFNEINTANYVLGKITPVGGYSVMGVLASGWVAGTRRMRVSLDLGHIVCEVNGVTIFDIVDGDNMGNTRHGLFNYNTITQRFDNFTIARR